MIRVDDHEVQQLIRQLIERGDDMTPVMRTISRIMMGAVRENQEREGRPTKWPALSTVTIVEREKKGYWPGKMLKRSGLLAQSYTRRAEKFRAIVGSNWPTARIHELGGEAGRGHKVHIPARPVLNHIPQSAVGEIRLALMTFLLKGQAG
jgi:phage virion morphogenesis protein